MDTKILENMENKWYDLLVWENPYDAKNSVANNLNENAPIICVKCVKLISMNGAFTGNMLFVDRNGALVIIPFCLVVQMIPSDEVVTYEFKDSCGNVISRMEEM